MKQNASIQNYQKPRQNGLFHLTVQKKVLLKPKNIPLLMSVPFERMYIEWIYVSSN